MAVSRLSMSLAALALLAPGCGGDTTAADAAATGDTGTELRDAPSPDAPGSDAPGADTAASSGVLIRAAEGGLVESADGLFEIYVFPGALAADTTITITRVPDAGVPADVLATTPLGGVYSVEPDGLTFGGDGAWGHYHLATPPAGAITMVGGVAQYADLDAHARPRDGGAIDAHEVVATSYDLDAGTVDVVTRLSHLSLQWATGAGGFGHLRADLGAPEQTVGVPWQASDLSITFPQRYQDDPRAPLAVAGLQSLVEHPVGIVSGVPGVADGDLLEAARAEFRVAVRGDSSWSEVLGAPSSMGATHFTWEPEGPRFVCLEAGDGRAHLDAGAAYEARIGAPRPHHLVTLFGYIRCVAPAAVADVTRTTTCRREGDAIDCTDAPVTTAEVTSPPETTRYAVLATSPYTVRMIPAADPPAAGPTTLSATNGTATLIASLIGGGEYDEVLTDGDLWDPLEATVWTEPGGGTVTTDPTGTLGTFHFGPSLGLDTDVVIDAEPTEGDLEVSVSWTGTVTCMGESFRDLVVSGAPPIVTFGDGTRGYEAPVREAVESVATHCGIPASELTVTPFYISIGASTEAALPLPMTRVRVRTGSAARIDGAALLATCPAGRTYCTDACVNTATDPMNCGGCGLMPAEVCDGVDNDCDGRVDEGCPSLLSAPASALLTSPSFGENVGGSSELSTICPYPSVATSLCGNIDTAGTMPTGNIRALRLGCGVVELATDRTTSPWTYSLQVTASPPCSTTGGGSSGGMPFDFPCPPGEVLEGINVVAGSHIGQIQARCARWEILPSGGTWIIARTGTSTSPMFGTGSGTPDGWVMPARSTSGFPGVILRFGGRYEVPGTFVRVETGGAWYSLTYR